MTSIPKTQHAVQLVGPDKIVFNDSKEVFDPGPNQILGKVETVGLCFSDLKLLKQFDAHVRKSEIVGGIDLEILKELPSYVPGKMPTVPGHEPVITVVKIGNNVKDYKVGQRFLIQADWRWFRTATSNGAFGYNVEGGLQEYALLDQRIITSPEGESMLLPVIDKLSHSAAALVEPWACVEDAYVSKERTTLKQNGKLLIVADTAIDKDSLKNIFDKANKPAQAIWISSSPPPADLDIPISTGDAVENLEDRTFDDIIYFGSDAKTAESLFAKLANDGLINFVLCGKKFGSDIQTAVGRIHYGGIRITGTTSSDAAEGLKAIPQTDEIRPGDKINIIGAAGPMGMMHVIRNICQGIKDITIFAGDLDDHRLTKLKSLVEPVAEKNNVPLKTYNSIKDTLSETFDYTVLMAPLPKLVAEAIKNSNHKGLINIFAGIPADIVAPMDLNTCIEKSLYMIGTSGSTLDDMKTVLSKVEQGTLDTNLSVGAICGLSAAPQGIRAVENRSIAGKILVYPACKGLALITLEDLGKEIPEVDACLDNGAWTKKAEEKLLQIYS